ncbi:MAG: hypothetical protein H5T34_00395 [Candidatus Methanomethyliales bacterium]|nr:hypothetical protein [Candidatus Methanomethylicales archaeon]
MRRQELKTLGLLNKCENKLAVRAGLGEIREAEFSRVVVIGDERARVRMMAELVMNGFEGGHAPLVMDLKGRYAGLIDYIPSMKIYKVGKHPTFNPLKEAFPGYSKEFALIFKEIYELSRDECIYLEKVLENAYRDGDCCPTLEGIFERLLRMEAEAQPKEGYKIECLKNVLSELEVGPLAPIFRGNERELFAPMILDLGNLTLKERVMMMVASLARIRECRATFVVIDGLDWSIISGSIWLKSIVRDMIEDLSYRGISVYIGSDDLIHAPIRSTAYVFCGPIWYDEVRWIRGLADGLDLEHFRYLEEGTGLVVTWKRAPFYLRFRSPEFRVVGDDEIEAHMKTLGEEVSYFDSAQGKSEGMLERLFRDRASLFYAKEFLRLVGEGRVPVEAVSSQRNATLRNVVRILKRYFLVVEHIDGTGTKWYRLTNVGEKALREVEGEEA